MGVGWRSLGELTVKGARVKGRDSDSEGDRWSLGDSEERYRKDAHDSCIV